LEILAERAGLPRRKTFRARAFGRAADPLMTGGRGWLTESTHAGTLPAAITEPGT